MIVKKKDGSFDVYSGWCSDCGHRCKRITIYRGPGPIGKEIEVSDCCDAEILKNRREEEQE